MSNTGSTYLSKKQLAAMYGIAVKTLSKEIHGSKVFAKCGKDYYKTRRILSPADCKKIFQALGDPLN